MSTLESNQCEVVDVSEYDRDAPVRSEVIVDELQQESALHAPMSSNPPEPARFDVAVMSEEGECCMEREGDTLQRYMKEHVQRYTAGPYRDGSRLASPSVFGWSNAAFPIHYLTTGYIAAVISGVLYGVLMGVMAVEAHVYMTSQTAILAPWGTKFILGMVSDHFPIMGFKRKYYGALGYLLVICAGVYLVFGFEEPAPFHCFGPSGANSVVHSYDTSVVCNSTAGGSAHLMVFALMLVSTGLVISDSAADGMMVETAQCGGTYKDRAHVPLTCFMLRTVGAGVGLLVLGVGFNGPRHLGFFTWEMQLRDLFWTLLGVSVPACAAWLFLAGHDVAVPTRAPCMRVCSGDRPTWDTIIVEPGQTRCTRRPPTRCEVAGRRVKGLFRVFCTAAFLRFMTFNLMAPMLVSMTSPVDILVRRHWADVQQLQQQAAAFVTSLSYLLCLAAIRRCMDTVNWTMLVAGTTLCSVCAHVGITTLVALGYVRNQYLFLVQDVVGSMPAASMYLLASLATVELAPRGQEASMYGIVTTVHALAGPMGRSIANALYGQLPKWIFDDPPGALSDSRNYVRDEPGFRTTVAAAAAISGLVVLCSIVLLPLAPRNLQEARLIAARHVGVYVDSWARSNTHGLPTLRTGYGVAVVLMLVTAMLGGIACNIWAILPTVRCMQVVGGSGCRAH
jgi:hypothetical protein